MTQVALEKKDDAQRVESTTEDLPKVPAAKKTRSVLVYLSIVWLVLIIGAAIFASVLPLAPYNVPIGPPRTPPNLDSLDTLLGTDTLGRSILSRVVYGAQVSLVIGAVAGLVGFLIGSFFGMIAGYFGKRVDAVISLLADAMLAFPPLILLLALASILTPSVRTILFGLGLLAIPSFIRLARANTLSWSSREFVRAAKNMGAGSGRILFREIMPNVLAPLASYMPIVIAALIVAEGSLSFLGLGIPPPQPSWGGMINDGKDAIATSPHLVFVPALVIFFTVFALNQVGDHLRTKYDRTLHD
ncbi:peptide/nickel transport system permease protein [Rhodococcus rhodochrous J3]|jgi:peptide/nickel transport system permease protein|uniref:Peptide/nickel transport system permease protein n=1 Tax=Rhodococcus rhodochrous J3 TaxID=903528 RepID=A0ABY1MG28_RHORH|nr:MULTISPECIES: ABC transporter permease [Rhodococcus]MBF4479932.1 ABC transporter permease [Rhodococcus rhodochrous]MDC3728612.1 ABC transporter permease [Rhodococcus sp. Rp3]MDJ0398448.1 ABC transporter permease [Rhodococcus rhodochrous]TWH62960.1 peptide/nickel transport system permease protein [Rhodococcus rhodochrous J38]WSE22123.1 ABC transporter permease [Rhodococcus sp. PD04]